MKIAILNDTHCGIRNSSDIFMDYQELFYRDVFFPYLLENNITRILHLGDYYDNRKTVNFKCLNHNRKIFLEKLREYGIKVMSIDVSGYSDIGEMPQEVVEQRKQNADIVSDLDYLHYKLDF